MHETPDYWRSRCAAAEEALARSRSAITLSETRRAVLRALADLKPNEALASDVIVQRISVKLTPRRLGTVLGDLRRYGLVDRVGHEPRPGSPGLWRLAHLVQVPE